jgi:hypothetical protein
LSGRRESRWRDLLVQWVRRGSMVLVCPRLRRQVKPVREWRWGRGRSHRWSRRAGESCRAGRSRPAGGYCLGWRINITVQVFGSDEDEARAGEVHKWMTANTAEAHDGSPASRPDLDLVGTRRDPIPDAPFTSCRVAILGWRLPGHALTPRPTGQDDPSPLVHRAAPPPGVVRSQGAVRPGLFRKPGPP